jgi:hypothetical protein
MQNYERESDFTLRTKEEHTNDLRMLDDLPTGRNHCHGGKLEYPLNFLDSYHISTDNWNYDSMHTALEGFVPYVSGEFSSKSTDCIAKSHCRL